jgi:hypothetical protein
VREGGGEREGREGRDRGREREGWEEEEGGGGKGGKGRRKRRGGVKYHRIYPCYSFELYEPTRKQVHQ